MENYGDLVTEICKHIVFNTTLWFLFLKCSKCYRTLILSIYSSEILCLFLNFKKKWTKFPLPLNKISVTLKALRYWSRKQNIDKENGAYKYPYTAPTEILYELKGPVLRKCHMLKFIFKKFVHFLFKMHWPVVTCICRQKFTDCCLPIRLVILFYKIKL